MNTEGKYIANKRVKHPYSWAKTTVYQMRIVERPPEEWVIVENTHEPLVDQATFDTVQERIKIKQPATWTNTDNMFRGLMICGRCNTRMVFTTRKNRKSKGHFSCNTHRRYGGKVGTVDSNSLPAPRIRRDTKLLKATSVLPTVGD